MNSCPGMGEILHGFKVSLTRDFGWFKKDHHVDKVINIKPPIDGASLEESHPKATTHSASPS